MSVASPVLEAWGETWETSRYKAKPQKKNLSHDPELAHIADSAVQAQNLLVHQSRQRQLIKQLCIKKGKKKKASHVSRPWNRTSRGG